MKNRFKTFFYYFIGYNRRSFPIRIMAKICSVFVNAYWNNEFYEMSYNGEKMAMEKISKITKCDSPVIFDVGANIGKYATLIMRYFPNVQLHCFELVPEIFENLINNENLRSNNVVLNCFGLSDSTGEVDVTYFPENSSLSGINPLPWNKREGISKRKIRAQVTRGDEYAAEHNITHIRLRTHKKDSLSNEFVIQGFRRETNDGSQLFLARRGAILAA